MNALQNRATMHSSDRQVRTCRALVRVFLAALFVAGAVHWVLFFDFGRLTFNPHDWPKESMYLSIWREALTTGRIPWHISRPIQDTDRFLANPETILSPQLVLLLFLGQGQFVVANTLLFYSVGFAGCLLLRRRYRLSLLPFTVLYLLYNFNGHVTAHFAVGHIQWTGYFLLPFFALYLLELLERPVKPQSIDPALTETVFPQVARRSGTRPTPAWAGLPGVLAWSRDGIGEALPAPSLKLALVLATMLFQGAFHFYAWAALFLALVCLFHRAYGRPLLTAIAASAAAGGVRILPAVTTFWSRDEEFISGYPTLGQLFAGLVRLRQSTYPWTGYVFGTLGWWEYDLYVGLAGLAVLLYFGIYLAARRRQELPIEAAWSRLELPVLCQTLLSFSFIYAPVAALPLPLVDAERVATRFIVLPFFLLILVSALRMQQWLERVRPASRLWVAGAATLLVLASDLATHSSVWALSRIEETYKGRTFDKTIAIASRPDLPYTLAVGAGLLMSIASLAVVSGLLLRPARFTRHRRQSAPDA